VKILYFNVFETNVKNLLLGKTGQAVCGIQLSLNASRDLRIGNQPMTVWQDTEIQNYCFWTLSTVQYSTTEHNNISETGASSGGKPVI